MSRLTCSHFHIGSRPRTCLFTFISSMVMCLRFERSLPPDLLLPARLHLPPLPASHHDGQGLHELQPPVPLRQRELRHPGRLHARHINYLRAGASACSLAHCRGGSHVCRRCPDEAFHMIEGCSIGNEMFLSSRVDHRCGVQREHDDNVRVSDRWVFLAELFVVLIGLIASRRARIFPCSLLTMRSPGKE